MSDAMHRISNALTGTSIEELEERAMGRIQARDEAEKRYQESRKKADENTIFCVPPCHFTFEPIIDDFIVMMAKYLRHQEAK